MILKRKFLGVAPAGTFSGFEKSFFDAVEWQGWRSIGLEVELPLYKILCTIRGFSLKKSEWALKRDLLYNTSVGAFKKKSMFAKSRVAKLGHQVDLVYQIGGLWNPIPEKFSKPFVISIDYTSRLSEKRGSEWKRKPGKEQEFWIREERELFCRADIICATTKNAMMSLVQDYEVPASKVTVVGAGVSAPYDVPDPDRFPNYRGRRVLFVGKGYQGKGLDTLLKAFVIVRREIPNAILTVVGPSAKVSGDGVEYLGRIKDREKVRGLFYRSSIFAMPSIFEPVGQVFLEAMSCQLPCIGTTLDAMPELIEHDKTGYVIEPGNCEELAERISYLLDNPNVARKMGIAGYNKLRTEFTWEVVGGRIISGMEMVL